MTFIDYQPEQFRGVSSKPAEELLLNVVALGKIARDFDVPTVLSTVGVEMGVNQPTSAELKHVLSGLTEIDRTSLNAWEDEEFVSAIKKTGRQKLIDTEGRVDRFTKKFGAQTVEKRKVAAKAAKETKAKTAKKKAS